jgi:hypothetical protein
MPIIDQARRIFMTEAVEGQAVEEFNPEVVKPDVDHVEPPPKNIYGEPLFNSNILFKLSEIS